MCVYFLKHTDSLNRMYIAFLHSYDMLRGYVMYTTKIYGVFPHQDFTLPHLSTQLLSLATRYSYSSHIFLIPANYVLTTFLDTLTFPTYAAYRTAILLLPKFTAAPRRRMAWRKP
jgi:hypothetical protein